MVKPNNFSLFSVNELLASPRLRPIIERLHPAAVLATVKGVYDDVSREMLSAASERRIPEIAELTEKILARLQDVEQKENRLIVNAGGIIFSHPKQTPVLGQAIVNEMLWRIDLPMTERTFFPDSREDALIRFEATPASVAKILCQRTGAEDALFFASPELAEIALFQIFGRKNPILTARRDMTEDTLGRRVIDRFAFCHSEVREVGSSNAVSVDDYLEQTDQPLGLVRLATGAGRPALSADEIRLLAEKVRPMNTPILLSVEFAPLLDLKDHFYDPVPTVVQRLDLGCDLLLFGGSQLIGGPNCGILLGAKRFLDVIRQSKIADLFLPHRADLAGLAKTIELSRNQQEAEREIPIIKQITQTVQNLQNRAQRLAPQLAACEMVDSVSIQNGFAQLTRFPLSERLPSVCLALTPKRGTASGWKESLENAQPALAVSLEENRIILNLKTVRPEYDALILRIIGMRE